MFKANKDKLLPRYTKVRLYRSASTAARRCPSAERSIPATTVSRIATSLYSFCVFSVQILRFACSVFSALAFSFERYIHGANYPVSPDVGNRCFGIGNREISL
jgi:hypothetical protein